MAKKGIGIVVGLGALAGLAALASKASAKTPSSGSRPGTGTTTPPAGTTPATQTGPLPSAGSAAIPASVVARISGALASGDPARMRALAAELRAEGYPDQARDLEAVAEQVEAAQAAGLPAPETQVPTVPGGTPGGTSPDYVEIPIPGGGSIPIPIGIPASAPGTGPVTEVPWPAEVPDLATAQDALAQTLAGRVAADTRTKTKTTYNRDLVREYQAAEELEKVDGLYGLRTALAIAERDIVPAKPFHWGSTSAPNPAQSVVDEKASWRSAMLGYAMSDSARSDEWTQAAQV